MNLFLDRYPNLLDEIKFTTKDIKNKLKTFKYITDYLKDDEIENRMRFPMFVDSFYNFAKTYQNIPSQQEFFDAYFADNAMEFKSKNYSAYIIRALKARLGRGYPSLIRDIHFALCIKESGQYDKVIYNRKLDKENDIDTLICIGNKMYGIALFVDNDRSNGFRAQKQERHQRFDNVTYIELPVELKDVGYGVVKLYSIRDINILQEKIRKADILNSYTVQPQKTLIS